MSNFLSSIARPVVEAHAPYEGDCGYAGRSGMCCYCTACRVWASTRMWSGIDCDAFDTWAPDDRCGRCFRCRADAEAAEEAAFDMPYDEALSLKHSLYHGGSDV